jgi:hypothetical protein
MHSIPTKFKLFIILKLKAYLLFKQTFSHFSLACDALFYPVLWISLLLIVHSMRKSKINSKYENLFLDVYALDNLLNQWKFAWIIGNYKYKILCLCVCLSLSLSLLFLVSILYSLLSSLNVCHLHSLLCHSRWSKQIYEVLEMDLNKILLSIDCAIN